MDRDEHLALVKTRALTELDADHQGQGRQNALRSVITGLGEHPDTASHAGVRAAGVFLLSPLIITAREVRQFIEHLR
jgi:hypothetical protein